MSSKRRIAVAEGGQVFQLSDPPRRRLENLEPKAREAVLAVSRTLYGVGVYHTDPTSVEQPWRGDDLAAVLGRTSDAAARLKLLQAARDVATHCLADQPKWDIEALPTAAFLVDGQGPEATVKLWNPLPALPRSPTNPDRKGRLLRQLYWGVAGTPEILIREPAQVDAELTRRLQRDLRTQINEYVAQARALQEPLAIFKGEHRLWPKLERRAAGGQATLFVTADRSVVKWANSGHEDDLRRELALLRAGAGRGVLPVRDHGVHAGRPFLVLPRADSDLAQWLAQPRPPADRARLARGVADSWSRFRAWSTEVHTDLTPGNWLLLDGRPVIADLGSAQPPGAAYRGPGSDWKRPADQQTGKPVSGDWDQARVAALLEELTQPLPSWWRPLVGPWLRGFPSARPRLWRAWAWLIGPLLSLTLPVLFAGFAGLVATILVIHGLPGPYPLHPLPEGGVGVGERLVSRRLAEELGVLPTAQGCQPDPPWDPSQPGALDYPATCLTLAQAKELANRLSSREGRTPAYDERGQANDLADGYRLLTFKQWKELASLAWPHDITTAQDSCRLGNLWERSTQDPDPLAGLVRECSDTYPSLSPVDRGPRHGAWQDLFGNARVWLEDYQATDTAAGSWRPAAAGASYAVPYDEFSERLLDFGDPGITSPVNEAAPDVGLRLTRPLTEEEKLWSLVWRRWPTPAWPHEP